MKRIVSSILCCVLLMAYSWQAFAAGAKYRYQRTELYVALNDGGYDSFIEAVKKLKAEHPLLMSDEWEEKFIAQAEYGKKFQIDMNSEYDLFNDYHISWFGDHRNATAEDQCVIVDQDGGFHLKFFFSMAQWIRIKKYTVVLNKEYRISNDLKDVRKDRTSTGEYYESFSIPLSSLNTYSTRDIEQIDNIAFRFYGAYDDDYVDYYLDSEELYEVNMILGANKAREKLNAMTFEWLDSVENVNDYSIPPADFVIFLKNDYPIYPSQTTVEDLNRLENADGRVFERIYKENKFTPGKVYFLPCVIEDITAPSQYTPQTAWEVKLKSQYNTIPNYGVSARIIIDHAIDMGWIDKEPQIGDEIIVVATYCGRGSVSFKEIFYLGDDQYTLDIANSFSG